MDKGIDEWIDRLISFKLGSCVIGMIVSYDIISPLNKGCDFRDRERRANEGDDKREESTRSIENTKKNEIETKR